MPSRSLGGAEQCASVLASACAARGDEVRFVTSFSPANESLRYSLSQAGVMPLDCDLELRDEERSLPKFAGQFLRCLWLVCSQRPCRALVFLPWPTVALAAICALAWAGVPTLLVFQLVAPDFLLGRWHRRLLQWAVGKPNVGAQAISHENRRLLMERMGLPPEKIAVVYNGSRQAAPISQEDRAASKATMESWGVEANEPLITTVGRLCFQKGYDLIAPVIPHLCMEFPQARFLWLGAAEEEYQASLGRALARLDAADRALMPGAVAHVNALLARSHVFLFPSRFEGGQSFALTEAMAAGLPIVASDASGIPEVIRHGQEGLIFRNGDSCDLMEKLRWALRHPQEMRRMGEAARQRQREFTEEQMIAGTLHVMGKIQSGTPLA